MSALHVNKSTKEDKVLTILLIIFFLLGGFYLIYVLLHENTPEEEKKVISNNVTYELVSETEKFKLYLLQYDDDNISINLNNSLIEYRDYNIYINGIFLADSVLMYDYIAFYNNVIVIVVDNIYHDYSGLLMFNTNNNQASLYKEIDSMSIIDPEYINISEAGVNVHISNYRENILTIDGKDYDICSYKKNPIIYKNIMYFYDYSIDDFYSIDVIETKNVNKIKKDVC